MNFGARLVAAAQGGEMVMSEAVWNYVSDQLSAEARDLNLTYRTGKRLLG